VNSCRGPRRTVAIQRENKFGGHAGYGKILPIQIAERDLIVWNASSHIVQANTVLRHAADERQIVLKDIVVAGAEKPHRERLIGKQKSTEIAGQGLDADAYAVEVVP